MQPANNIKALRDWFSDCPLLQPDAKLGIDFLTENPVEYSIFAVPSSLEYRENILGERVLKPVQTQNFIFASRDAYSSEASQNAENLYFHQLLVGWIYEQNALDNFPEWEGRVLSISPTLTGAPVSVGSDTARYQIQLAVKYRR